MSMDIWDEVTAEFRTICLKSDGELYRVIGYQPNPTVIFENVRTGKKEYHAVGCLNIQEFQQLTVKNPEESK